MFVCVHIYHLTAPRATCILTRIEWNEWVFFFSPEEFCRHVLSVFLFQFACVCTVPTSDLHKSEFRLMRSTGPTVFLVCGQQACDQA